MLHPGRPTCFSSYGWGCCLIHVLLRFLKHTYPSWKLTPWVQKYGILHHFDYFFWVAPGLLVFWPASFLLRVLIYSCIWLVTFFSSDMSESLFTRWLAYLATWAVRFMLEPVRLFTSSLSSAVAWARLANAFYIPIGLLALYPPYRDVLCSSHRSDWASMEWAWKAVQDFFSCALQNWQSSG